jgi:putative ABC transport system permease protein
MVMPAGLRPLDRKLLRDLWEMKGQSLAIASVIAAGAWLGSAIMTVFNNEVYRLSFVARPATIAWAFLAVIAAACVSGLLVRRRLDRLDLVAALETRE